MTALWQPKGEKWQEAPGSNEEAAADRVPLRQLERGPFFHHVRVRGAPRECTGCRVQLRVTSERHNTSVFNNSHVFIDTSYNILIPLLYNITRSTSRKPHTQHHFLKKRTVPFTEE